MYGTKDECNRRADEHHIEYEAQLQTYAPVRWSIREKSLPLWSYKGTEQNKPYKGENWYGGSDEKNDIGNS